MALTQKDLQAIGTLMDSKLEAVNKRLDTMQDDINGLKTDIEQIKKDNTITRAAVNDIGEWTKATAAVLKIKYPIR